MMEKNVFVSIYLDARRRKSNGKFPVKLRVFTRKPRIQKLYSTQFEFDEKEFESIWETIKPRTEHKITRSKLSNIEIAAINVADSLEPFTFQEFERKLFRTTSDSDNVFYNYEQMIEKLRSNKQFGTASNYDLSLKSLKNYLNYKDNREPSSLSFYKVTADWLQGYENYMIGTLGRSSTSVSIYIRVLRTIFNSAISHKDIDIDLYPFGKGKYQPPTSKGVKKSLNNSQLKELYNAEPQTEEQSLAKDFWFFSFGCNGMNMKDILLLRNSNLDNDLISFVREKTKRTNKTSSKPITVFLNDTTSDIINRYRNEDRSPKALLFPFLSLEDNEETHRIKVQNFTKKVNQHIKKLAVEIGLPEEISTYWARHSFATKGVHEGVSMEFMSEALGHKNISTTRGYIGSFPSEVKKEFSKSIFKF